MPDLYESTMPLNLVFFLTVPKITIMLVFINLYRLLFVHFFASFLGIAFFFGILSMIVGSIGALGQQKVSRVLAYSSVAYAGMFVLLTAVCFVPSVRLGHLPIVFGISYIFVLFFFLTVYAALRYSPFFFYVRLCTTISNNSNKVEGATTFCG